jgi:hypothetical protein
MVYRLAESTGLTIAESRLLRNGLFCKGSLAPPNRAVTKNHNSSAILAVSDLARARAFYGGVLGLELIEEGGEESVLTYRTGATGLTLYPLTSLTIRFRSRSSSA